MSDRNQAISPPPTVEGVLKLHGQPVREEWHPDCMDVMVDEVQRLRALPEKIMNRMRVEMDVTLVTSLPTHQDAMNKGCCMTMDEFQRRWDEHAE